MGARRGATWPLAGPAALLLVALVASYTPTARADFFKQIFVNPCKPVRDPPPFPGFLRWSAKSTWAKLLGRPVSVIPGVGPKGALANVTIPCGRAVLLDVPTLNLTYLDVRGWLKVEDAYPRKRVYRVHTSFVSVEGQLTIGSSKQHFRNRIIFNLMPNRKARLPLLVKGAAYPDKANRRKLVTSIANVGHKAFAVVGGQVRLYGMPGGRQTPSWVRLSATAYEGTNKIRVAGDVSRSWFVGAAIAVASTDFHYDHAEEFRIRALRRLSQWETQITLDKSLKWRHMGVRVSDGMGGTVDERAEVALLSRNIMITGLVEGGDYLREGGHFIVHQTAGPQIIEGVEFYRLGQQGTLGRYNIHFHVCGDDRGRSSVYKNSIHDSNQRCVVVHATHNLTVDSNVAYNTSGHCFLVEEGGEQDNTFINNLGFLTVPVAQSISKQETDKDPSTFWISNIKNNYVGNVAAGSASSGFWTELRGGVRGMSRLIPELADIQPLYFGPGGRVDQNVLHSNWLFGFRTYPHGVRALGDGYYPGAGTNPADLLRVNYTITRLLAYKHRRMGVFLQASGAVVIRRSSFADNNQGVYIQSDTAGVVEDSRFVGVTSNIGTPPPLYQCKREYGPRICAPIKGCQFPPTDPNNVRSMPVISWQQPIFGILTSGISYLLQSSPNAQMARNRFSGYDATCRPAAGVGFGMWLAADWWDAAVALQGTRAAPTSPPVWFPPPVFVDPVSKDTWYAGEALTRDLVLRDTTGSVVGGTGGYIVANDSFLLPPSRPGKPWGCKALRRSNAFACPGTCYRTVKISYVDYGFEPYPTSGDFTKKKPGDYSYLVLQRNSDKKRRSTDGNLQISYGNGGRGPLRWFYLSLLSGATYDVTIKPGRNNASFWPDSVTVSYADGFGKDKPCRGAVSLRFMPKGMGRQWVVNNDKGVFWSPCPGLTYSGSSRAWPVYYHHACYSNMRTLLMRLNSNFKPGSQITLTPTGGAVQRCKGSSTRCGVVPDEDWYAYDDRGLELHSTKPKVPGFQSLLYKPKGWKYGKAIIGFVQYFGPTLGTKAAQGGDDGARTRNTFYFRRSFTVSTNKLWCYSGIEMQYYPTDGLVAYLNGNEVFRFGMPAGRINASTYATSDPGYEAYAKFATKTVPLLSPGSKRNPLRLPKLRRGTNVLAFEVHLHNGRDFSWYFDATTALLYRC